MREATQVDLPKGREAQCPMCWRLFRSDHACEAHKPYRRPVGPLCKDPAGLGMVALERRSLAVWGIPIPPEALRRLRGETVERSDAVGP